MGVPIFPYDCRYYAGYLQVFRKRPIYESPDRIEVVVAGVVVANVVSDE